MNYQTLLNRKSIRKFKVDGLSQKNLQELDDSISHLSSFRPDVKIAIDINQFEDDSDIRNAVGIFGKVMSPPYILVPYLESIEGDYSDLGYLSQQVVQKLWADGIGSCYIGCIHRQNQVKRVLGLDDFSKIAASIFFGYPSEDQTQRFYRKISRLFVKSDSRKSLNELFIKTESDSYTDPENLLTKIIQAGRYSPSARNAQPWRFRIEGNEFMIFARKHSAGKIYDFNQDYSTHDTGICMANMTMAANSLGFLLRWESALNEEPRIQDAEVLFPIAKFSINDLRKDHD
jgi:nitroreductase